ncbi:MAG: COG4223 family protein [Yoonia sp.]
MASSDVIPPEVHAKAAPPAAPPTDPVSPDTVVQEPEPAPPKAPPPEPTPAKSLEPLQKSGPGFLPLLLGGVVAGAIGFAVASLTMPPAQADLDEILSSQDARLTSLQQRVDATEPVDLTSVTEAQEDLASQLAGLRDDLSTMRAEFDDRIAALEDQPTGEGEAFAPNTAAFEAEIAALRAELTELTDIARTELDSARAEAAAIEENAAAAARNAAGRAALARVQTGIESGAPITAALTDLEQVLGEPVSDALLAVQDGVPTLAALQDSFPDYARAALTRARTQGVAGEDTSGITAFLRNQFEVRSVDPRDGDDVDAILSRAQAALRNGRLGDTLNEVNSLPEVARAELSDWLALAEARADAVAAAETLASSLRDN